jgi:hypothetical protein
MEKQKDHNLRYLLAKVRNNEEKRRTSSDSGRKKRNKNRVERHPTSEQNSKIILSDKGRCRIGKG